MPLQAQAAVVVGSQLAVLAYPQAVVAQHLVVQSLVPALGDPVAAAAVHGQMPSLLVGLQLPERIPRRWAARRTAVLVLVEDLVLH